MIKIFIGIVIGVVSSGMLFFGARFIFPSYAESDDSSDNTTGGLAELLPDIEKIYNTALTMPFQKAESKIYDPEIAEFYHELINSTGLGGTQVD